MRALNKSDFSQTCGLKFDRLILLNQEDVYQFYLDHVDWFQTLTIDTEKDGTFYGYLDNGFPYKYSIQKHFVTRLVLAKEPLHEQRIKATIMYDGTEFSGFQMQKNDRSVQGELETIVSEIHDAPTRVNGASRTDAGVHATGQVIHFDSTRNESLEKWKYYFQKKLPKDIGIQSVEFVHPLFHSRYDVLYKEYRYIINTGPYDPLKRHFEWTVDGLNLDILSFDLHELIGTHDFKSFSKGDKEDTFRTIHNAYFIKKDERIELIFIGDGFLRYMIRLIVFALVKRAKEAMEVSISDIIADHSRKYTTHLAPACGLTLTKVVYHE